MDDKGSWVLDALSLKTGPEIKIVDENPKPVDLWQYPDGAGEEDGTSAVQILRTYPCGFTMLSEFSKKRWEFARLGELSYLRGFEKAALRAREYIYIEDQYGLFENGIFRALSLALEAGLKHLVVLLAKDSGVHLAGCAASQFNMWMVRFECSVLSLSSLSLSFNTHTHTHTPYSRSNVRILTEYIFCYVRMMPLCTPK